MIHFCIDFGCPTLTNPRACHCEWWHAGPPRLLATSARSTRRSASRPPILSRCIGGVVVSRCVVWHSDHRTYSAVTLGGNRELWARRTVREAVARRGSQFAAQSMDSIVSLHAAGRRCDGDCCGRAADGCVTCCTRLPDRKKCAQLCIQADTVALPDWAGASGAGHNACRWSAPMTGARGSSCSQVVVANGVQLAGHVIVEDDAVIGGMCGVRQFVAIGRCLFPIRNDTSTASCAKELPACLPVPDSQTGAQE